MLGLTSRNKWKGRICGMIALCVWISALPMAAADAEQTLHVSQQATGKMKGKIIDGNGEPLPGATVQIVGSTRGVIADENGNYELDGIAPGTQVTIAYIGMESKTLTFQGEKTLDIVMEAQVDELEEVSVVAFAKQKKESVVASISTVNMKDLKVPSSNLTTALAGRIAGLISYQRTGEPGRDNSEFFIRGVTTFGTGISNPLILIDGVEMTTEDLARLTTDDIASFSIMKDANATALYGARGANGVVLVNTKEGREGKTKVQVRMEGSYSAPTQTMEYADPVTYMTMHNEAVRTRDPMAALPYASEKILYTAQGRYPLRYPSIDWQERLFSPGTFNQRYNMNVSGGGQVANYYIAVSYVRDNGIIKMDSRNNFNNNIRIDRYVLRSNVNVNLTKTTVATVRLHGAFDDYSGPLDGGADLYRKALNANPVYFQPYYEPDYGHRGIKHILFGNYDAGNHLNPYAEMVKGYKSSDRSDMLAQFEVRQKLDFITEGLFARALFNVNRYSLLEMRRAYNPFYYSLLASDNLDDYELFELNPNTGRENLELLSSGRELQSTMYFEAALQYNKDIGKKHKVSGLLVYTLRELLDGNPPDIQSSLPQRNLGLSGRLTYSYDSRYFFETNFGYNGSERFSKDERFGFFPSVGGGWIVSNESFMKPLANVISLLKLKATYGLVGNDAIGNLADRFFYLSRVNVNDANRAFTFGNDFTYTRNGVSVSRYGDPTITWELSRKTNLGVELNLWNSLEVHVDFFREARSKIMQVRADIPTTMGLQTRPSSNIGKASGQGIDMSADYSKTFGKDWWAVLRGNFTFASSKFDVYEEPDYGEAPWRSHRGQKINQQWGFVAERLFTDEEEVANSPTQFGQYGAGDIKYRDINGDMVINDNDMVPIGFPTVPEINYGFGVSAGYRNIDLSFFFQGSARSAFWIDPAATAPFVTGAVSGFMTSRALLKYYADDHWSETDRNIYALWPRLSPTLNENNGKRSTWFMRDGSFLRLKTAELGYTLPERVGKPLKLSNVRVYVSGSNLFLLSVFKMWDPEMAGNGLQYPLQRVVNLGVNVEF